MMSRQEKEVIVASLKEKLESSRALFLTNLIGVPSNDSNSIRKEVREADGTIVVTRNTLFRLAAKGTAAEEMFSDLKGTNAVALAFKDAPAVAKAIYNASKEHEVIEFRGGILGDKILTKEEMIELAQLPSREEMLGTLLATFNAPISAFARVMNAIKDKNEEGGSTEVQASEAEATPAEEAAPEAEAKAEENTEETKTEDKTEE